MHRAKLRLLALVALVVLGGGAYILGSGFSGNTDTPTSDERTSGAVPGRATKEFDLAVTDFAYQPTAVDVNLGDTVVLNITNNDTVTHGINLPIFGVAEFVAPGQTQRVSFVADKTGNPELFCSSDHGEKLLVNVRG